jgi:hypothetical protein
VHPNHSQTSPVAPIPPLLLCAGKALYPAELSTIAFTIVAFTASRSHLPLHHTCWIQATTLGFASARCHWRREEAIEQLRENKEDLLAPPSFYKNWSRRLTSSLVEILHGTVSLREGGQDGGAGFGSEPKGYK